MGLIKSNQFVGTIRGISPAQVRQNRAGFMREAESFAVFTGAAWDQVLRFVSQAGTDTVGRVDYRGILDDHEVPNRVCAIVSVLVSKLIVLSCVDRRYVISNIGYVKTRFAANATACRPVHLRIYTVPLLLA